MPTTTAPSPSAVANRSLTSAYPTTSGNDAAANELSSYLTGNGATTPSEQNYENTILGQYNTNKNATEQAYQQEYQGIQNDYNAQLADMGLQQGQDTQNFEAQGGDAGRGAALNYLKTGQALSRSTLLGNESAAVANAQTATQNELNTLSDQYATNLQTGRSNMQSGLESAATLQTPEEQTALAQQQAQNAAIVTLQSEAPDAGITSSDTYDEAVAKYKNSNYYKANIGQAEQTLANLQKTGALTTAQQAEANAAAAANAATAAMTNRQLTYLPAANASTSGPTFSKTDPNVAYLLAGGTVENLAQNLQGTPAAAALQQYVNSAKAYGYDENAANIKYQEEINAGNQLSGYNMLTYPIALGAQGVGALTNAAGNAIHSWFGGGGNRSLTAPPKTITVKSGNSAGLTPGVYSVDANGNLTPQ